jgi:hypothetical protein
LATDTALDWGNDLVVGHHFLGNTVGNQGLTYPPIMPLMVALLSTFVPITVVTSVIGAAAGVMPYAGVYLALRILGPRFVWVIAPLPLLIASSMSELVAFGGAPQLIANGCFPIAMVSAALLLDHPTRKRAIIFGSSIFVLAGSSEEVFGPVIISLFVLLLLEGVCRPASVIKRIRQSLSYFVLASIPLLLLLPTYVPLVGHLGFSQTTNESAIYTPMFNWRLLTREDHYFWDVCLLISLFVAYYCFVHIRDSMGPLLRAGVSTLLVGILFILFIPDTRFSYLLPVGVCFALALVASNITRESAARWSLGLNILIAAVFMGNLVDQFQSSSALLTDQITFYGATSPSILDMKALQFIKTHTSSDSLFAVTSISPVMAPIGWWVEGYAERPALIQGALLDLYYASQKKQSKMATEIFSSFPSMHSFQLAKTFDVKYLVVFRDWNQFIALTTQNFIDKHHNLVVFSNGDVVIFKVP